MLRASSFTFGSYSVDTKRSRISFSYCVRFRFGLRWTFTDHLILHDVPADAWEKIPHETLTALLQSLLLVLGINYWCVFPTRNIRSTDFSLTREQAQFWDTLYLHGLAEFFYEMQWEFENLIAFPYDETLTPVSPIKRERPARALLLHGAGKDSILSAELLKEIDMPFDFFSFEPTPAHWKIAALVGAKNITVSRKKDRSLEFFMSLLGTSYSYPSVSTFTFIAALLAELLDYTEIIFSNEKSADFGNLTYRGLPVNHQWCKSTEAETLINDYLQRYVTPNLRTHSLLRSFSELEIVERFVAHPQYLPYVTSCNRYFWLPPIVQRLQRKAYWCKKCPKCVFLFACYAAFLPKATVVEMFGADLYAKEELLPLIRSILGTEGFKPLDCVGEPGEMILAMQRARDGGEYAGEPAMQEFENLFP